MQLSRVIPIALLLAATVAAAEPQLEVVSASLNPDLHQITVTLVNHSSKTAVAWLLEVRQFDAAGKPLQPVRTGVDWAGSLIWSDRPDPHFIAGGAQAETILGAPPEVVGATAAVLAVIYIDRSGEGNAQTIALFFDSRARHAQQAAIAEQLLATYPASLEEARARFEQLSAISERSAAVSGLLSAAKGMPDRKLWSAAAAEQKTFADGLARLTKESH